MRVHERIVPRERRGLAINGKELLERGIRRGIVLWRIEDKLDWQENHRSRWAEYDIRKRRAPVIIHCSMHDVSSCAAGMMCPRP